MAAESVNMTDDNEMAECDGDKVVTMMDVLQEQQDFEEDANAVLGASDDKNCTYSQGYIKRQAIYACLTCCPDVKTDPTKRAGVCLACSLNCHENHELIELYTKRNFRCDCGNPKFNSNSCQFTPNKYELNPNNVYNQNFSGLYCTCQRPYPDPEAAFEDDMIQCIICEDWHHASHLNTVVPANDQYTEMICKDCMDKNEFLHDYSSFAVNIESIDIDVITVNGTEPTLPNNEMQDKVTSYDSEFKPDIPNGIDVEMAENTSEITDKNEESSNQKTIHSTEESNGQESEEGTTINSAKETVTESPKELSLSGDKAPENENTELCEYEETHSDSKITSDVENNIISNEETNKSSDALETPVPETQEQTIEGCKTDSVAENANTNRTDDIDSEHLIKENAKSPTSKESTSHSEKIEDYQDEVAATISGNGAANNEKSTPLTTNEDKSEATQDEQIDKDNSDAVMDAIDELLDGPRDLTNNEKDCHKQPSTESSKDGMNSESDRTPIDMETSINDSNEKTNTVGEITNNDSLCEKSEPTIDSEKKESVENEYKSVTDEKSETADNINLVNCDSSNENKALIATDSTTKLDDNKASNKKEITNESKRKLSIEPTDEISKKAKLDSKCVRPKGVKKVFKGATFWSSNFRQILCTCGECISMYKDLNVLFLTDLEDTVSFYESLGKTNTDANASQYERGLQALSSLDRIHQINALTEYNNMRDRLLDFLKSFKDRQEIVKEEDIRAFFAGMKPRREPDGVYFCR